MHGIDASGVRSIHLFAGVAEEHFRGVLETAFVRRCAPRERLFDEGDSAEFLHILMDGGVELYAELDDEHETTIAVMRPVSVFILAAAVGDQPYLASGRTLKSSEILMIPVEAVRRMFDADKAFARAIACELSRAFGGVLTELKNQKLLTSLERVADWLLRTDAELGESGRFTLPFDKRMLASHLGMTPENLSRNLKSLADHGVVIRGRSVVLENPQALAAIARPQDLAA